MTNFNRCFIDFTENWVKHIWENTMLSYNNLLKDCQSGTGGRSRISTTFEGWIDAKLNKLHVDVEKYDHTNIKKRPAMLISGYYKHHTLYLTIIHL